MYRGKRKPGIGQANGVGLAAAREAVIQARLQTEGPPQALLGNLNLVLRVVESHDLIWEVSWSSSYFAAITALRTGPGVVSRGQVWPTPRQQQWDAEAWTDGQVVWKWN